MSQKVRQKSDFRGLFCIGKHLALYTINLLCYDKIS